MHIHTYNDYLDNRYLLRKQLHSVCCRKLLKQVRCDWCS